MILNSLGLSVFGFLLLVRLVREYTLIRRGLIQKRIITLLTDNAEMSWEQLASAFAARFPRATSGEILDAISALQKQHRHYRITCEITMEGEKNIAVYSLQRLGGGRSTPWFWKHLRHHASVRGAC